RYQVENGLSHNTIRCVLQDRHGFLWLGTKDGLNRFDGISFKVFRHDPETEGSISSGLISALFIDSRGVLWVGTDNGLHRYDERQETFERITGTETQYIRTITEDKKGRLWFVGNGLQRFDLASGRLLENDYSLSATYVATAPDGTVWAASNSGLLYRFTETGDTFTTFNVFAHSAPVRSRHIDVIYCTADNRILVGTSCQGLKRFDIATGKYRDLLTHNPDRTDIFVRDIIHYEGSEYVLATESGLFIYNLSKDTYVNLKKKYTDPYSISDNAVYSLCKDREGGLWAGTFFGGVNYYPRPYQVFQKYFPDHTRQALSGNAVRVICRDRYGNLWAGTEDGGISCLEQGTGQYSHYMPDGKRGSISYSNIHGLAAFGNELWIGTFEHGLNVMDLRTRKVVRYYKAGPDSTDLKSNFIFDFAQTRNGRILIATAEGCYYYNRSRENFTPIPHLSRYTYSILEAADGTIWAGTSDRGVQYYNPATGDTGSLYQDPANRSSILIYNVNALMEDSRGHIWICTEGKGLHRYDPLTKTLQRYTTREGMPSDFVFKALEDDGHKIWVTTSKGLVCLNRATGGLKVFTTANGLLNDQFNYNSGFKDADGRLYFGSVKGMISFNPGEFRSNAYVPPVYITGFQVNNRELVINRKGDALTRSLLHTNALSLAHDQSSFSIDFAAISFTAPQITEYQYRMEGIDAGWTHIKSNRRVYFTDLAPGTYTFRLKAAVNGQWSPERTLAITIRPPFWATSWAYVLYATIAALVLYYMGRIYHERQEAKKEKEIYEAKIDFFTKVAHEIRTPLTLIKGPVENLSEVVPELPQIRDDVRDMERNTDRLLKLINQILDFRQTETKGFALEFTRVDALALVQEAFLTFRPAARKKGLDYSMETHFRECLLPADAEALQKICSNLLSNAVKYAEHEVRVELLQRTGEAPALELRVHNDGYVIPAAMSERIFEPFFRLPATAHQKGTGIGLALARSLAELHEGKLYLEPGDKNRNTFVLTLPLNRQATAIRKKKSGALHILKLW
ncbi:MAG TPA: two-component regulator propeller domain-containing protein, partial [Chitinophagaceae bacterium]|nr:two-component regulator propeller domain-containing protein [Chitinophagaceae bacterium]